MDLSKDNCSNVRLSFIWASENIATNTPTAYREYISIFVELLDDEYNRVRMEAPEMFRVLGKRKPEYVKKYIEKLTYILIQNELCVFTQKEQSKRFYLIYKLQFFNYFMQKHRVVFFAKA